MLSARDIRLLLFIGYCLAYPLAVLPPIFVDPLLSSHVIYHARHYEHAQEKCLMIFIGLVICEWLVLSDAKSLKRKYLSVLVFLVAIAVSLPIFLPEFPHGNVFNVGTITSFIAAFSIFVWFLCERVALDDNAMQAAGPSTLDYIKALFAFLRQGAFAGVALFGALFFAAFTTDFKYAETAVTQESDRFWLHLNTAMQIAFYTIFLVVGPLRYLFLATLTVLAQFKAVTAKMDRAPEGSSTSQTTGVTGRLFPEPEQRKAQ